MIQGQFMKKILLLLFVLTAANSFPAIFDLSVGGGYKLGGNYTYDYLFGFHQQVFIPVSVSFYPMENRYFSIGLRNKFGYGITVYSKEKTINKPNSITTIKFNSYPYEHEIYEDLGLLIKAGKSVKFSGSIGCTLKYCFVNIPDGSFETRYNPYDPDIEFNLLSQGDFNYLCLGPSLDLGLEIINRSRTFAFSLGFPMDFLIPMKKIDKTKVRSVISGNYIYLVPEIDNSFYLNFSIGIEAGFSFYFTR